MMRHPLTTLSLTPLGFVLPQWQERLKWNPSKTEIAHWVNHEQLILRIWDRYHRLSAPRPFPTQTIIHSIVPMLEDGKLLTHGDLEFDGLPYHTRNILVLSSTVQWFGTNVGWCFLTYRTPEENRYPREFEFKMKLDAARNRRILPLDIVSHIVASVSEVGVRREREGRHFRTKPYRYNDVLPQDRVVVDALMLWLGTDAGRAFIAAYVRRRDKFWNIVRMRRREAVLRQQLTT